MVLVGCAIFPHGCMTLDPSRSGLPDKARLLHDASVKCAKEIRELNPDLIVLSTPHGVTLSKSLGNNTIASANF
jgi:aromatic ring-opening dioxygenase LigB subunit